MLFCVGTAFAVPVLSPRTQNEFVVVIDAGHGGRDGGAVGTQTGKFEKDINLDYTYCLKNMLETNGITAVLTRSDGAGLYQEIDTNKKVADMKKREELLNSANANAFVSIHMNSFPLTSARGAQVFYTEDNASSESFATLTQTTLKKIVPFAKATPKTIDFYLLKVSPCPAILVECGYLSNPEEELLLLKQSHMEKICYSIFCGLYAFLNISAT
ncbi:MAG: N-acetylmuramoyl-L-alanine amidase [Clostridia bacterium]